MKNNFFQYLLWLLRVTDKQPEIPRSLGYMENRWISMTNNSNAQIVNMTTNRWLNCLDTFNPETISKFYRSLIPRYTKKLEYLKKPLKEENEVNENIEFYSNLMELSKREIEMYENTLEELNLTSK